jgi:O-succinylbenzoic acid--CoA ligase
VVRALVGDAFGAAARPARVIELPAMPLLPSGKPDRRAIAARAIADAG